jgi:hypothetical protein
VRENMPKAESGQTSIGDFEKAVAAAMAASFPDILPYDEGGPDVRCPLRHRHDHAVERSDVAGGPHSDHGFRLDPGSLQMLRPPHRSKSSTDEEGSRSD